ncbi:FAD/NAD(P)-binding protein [uncultured Kriegella sp.]|uniref:FAD/NAD(P)-binding protein n=1 Tax=uncultured Kriegella sp. TaxID=1798910 RepID=UPI0030DCC359|tara:strand:+ start:41080 stop:42909 length:1830 start_codon:yes stop_codon:yes gene_type:complete
MNRYKVAIIGLGPKGLYAFERLLASLQQVDDDFKLEIHLFEKTGFFGAGETYRPDQPTYLLMNYPNRNISVWSKENPQPLVPDCLDFVGWLKKHGDISINSSANGFASRRTVGEYFIDCFNLLEKYKKESIQLFKHKAEVMDIETCENGLILKYIAVNTKRLTSLKVQEVLLTTGHSSFKGRLASDEKSSSSDEIDSELIPFVYPVEKKLAAIGKQSNVGIKGLGLTFIDTVLALTEGRGGRFETLKDGNLIYIPSGQEPQKIFPYSRSGLPMIPRSANEGLKPYTPIYFTHENIMSQAGLNQKISFKGHVLPLIIAEMKYRYYRIKFQKHNLNFYPDKNLRSLQEQIDIFHELYPWAYRFNFQDLLRARPMSGTSSELGDLAYWRYLLKEAKADDESSAFMAAAMTWGRLSPIFNSIYNFGGMTADSHALFDTQYRSVLNRISYGPPLENMKKMTALIEAGVINMDFAQNPQIKKLDEGWGICTEQLNFQRLNVLIDARIPSLNAIDDWSLLFTNMRERGLLRPFTIYDDSSYEVGCPEIDRQGRAIGHDGRSIFNISLYGTPTEGITYDNDTLSRTRNNFASQWALNVMENCKAAILKSGKLKIQNG